MIYSIVLILYFNLAMWAVLSDLTYIYSVRDYFKYQNGAMKVINLTAILIVGFIAFVSWFIEKSKP